MHVVLDPHKKNVPLMKCGHSANGRNSKTGRPVCVICAGLTPDAEIEVETPSLEGRTARCAYYGARPYKNECPKCRGRERCKCEEQSSSNLAFFEYRPDAEYDSFYCGCSGWD